MKQAGIKPLSQEQKDELRKKRENYRAYRDKTLEEIRSLEDKIRVLRADLEKEVPGVPGGRHVHNRGCELRTVIFSGTTPQGGLAGGDDTYYCVFCEEYTD